MHMKRGLSLINDIFYQMFPFVFRKMMAVPIVDGIDWDNFRYHPVYGAAHHRGIFEWGFLYKESQVPKKELNRRQHNSEPYR